MWDGWQLVLFLFVMDVLLCFSVGRPHFGFCPSLPERRERARPSIRPAVWNDAGLLLCKCPFLSRREALEQTEGGSPPQNPVRSPPILQARTATFPATFAAAPVMLSDELILTRTRLALQLCLPAPITGVCFVWFCCGGFVGVTHNTHNHHLDHPKPSLVLSLPCSPSSSPGRERGAGISEVAARSVVSPRGEILLCKQRFFVCVVLFGSRFWPSWCGGLRGSPVSLGVCKVCFFFVFGRGTFLCFVLARGH